jgi:hypothetical protein
MVNKPSTKPTEKDPQLQPATSLMSQQNWLDAGKQKRGVYEYEMYSDAHTTGEFVSGLGPYSFINTIPIPTTPGVVTSPIIHQCGGRRDQQ